LCLDR